MKQTALAALRSAETRVYTAVRSVDAQRVPAQPEVSWSINRLSRHEFCLLVSFRRDGGAVPTPVWFAVDDERIVLRSAASDGKVKRIQRRPEVLIAGCDLRGKPLAPPMRGRARVLEHAGQVQAAEAALDARYGIGRRAYGLTRALLLDPCYIEICEPEAVSAKNPRSAS